jgi:hypothetical protein
MLDPQSGNKEQWLWEATECRSGFEAQINTLFKSSSADWIWADHIPLPSNAARPKDAPYLESFYEKQIKAFGASTLDHIEKLKAATKAIVTAAGRFPMSAVAEDVRTKVAMLTNEFVEVSVTQVLSQCVEPDQCPRSQTYACVLREALSIPESEVRWKEFIPKVGCAFCFYRITL